MISVSEIELGGIGKIMSALGFSDGVADVIEPYRLFKFPFITHGSTTILFGDDDKVFRLSSDAASHSLVARANRVGGISVPKMYSDSGEIRVQGSSGDEESYWLGEFERMESLDVMPELKEEFRVRLDNILAVCVGESLIFAKDQPALIEKLELTSKTHKFYRIAHALAQLTRWCPAEMDLGLSNIMLRKSTGEIVVVDPAHGAS